MPKNIERAALIDRVRKARQQRLSRLCSMVLGDRVPGLGLSGLHPRQDVFGKQDPHAVVFRRVTFRIQPAIGGEVLADFALEVDLFVKTHAVTTWTTPRTSIFPVTAAEMRAVRRSCSRSI